MIRREEPIATETLTEHDDSPRRIQNSSTGLQQKEHAQAQHDASPGSIDEGEEEGGGATTDESETSSARYRIARLNSRTSRVSIGSQFFTLEDLGSMHSGDVSSLDDASEVEINEEEIAHEEELYEGSQDSMKGEIDTSDMQVRFAKVHVNKKIDDGDQADDEVSDIEDEAGFESPNSKQNQKSPSKPLKSSLQKGKFSALQSPGARSQFSEYTEEEVTCSEAGARPRRTSFRPHINRHASTEVSGEWTEVEISDSDTRQTPQMKMGRYDSRRSIASAMSEYTEVSVSDDYVFETDYEEEIIEEIIEEECA
jgi:hypothetical protein